MSGPADEYHRNFLKARIREEFNKGRFTVEDIVAKTGFTELAIRRVFDFEEPTTLFKLGQVAGAMGFKIDLVRKEDRRD
jgi:Holliday junction resolvasome RuvABC endonuclease subunit